MLMPLWLLAIWLEPLAPNPIQLPRIWLPVLAALSTAMPALLLPPIRLPAPAVVPPIVL